MRGDLVQEVIAMAKRSVNKKRACPLLPWVTVAKHVSM